MSGQLLANLVPVCPTPPNARKHFRRAAQEVPNARRPDDGGFRRHGGPRQDTRPRAPNEGEGAPESKLRLSVDSVAITRALPATCGAKHGRCWRLATQAQ